MRLSASLNYIFVIVGSSPDMVLPTSDCTTVLVAIEAVPYYSSTQIIDPQGGVGIIRMENGTITYKMLDFTDFDST